jgi:hypothetical protein
MKLIVKLRRGVNRLTCFSHSIHSLENRSTRILFCRFFIRYFGLNFAKHTIYKNPLSNPPFHLRLVQIQAHLHIRIFFVFKDYASGRKSDTPE